MPGSEFDTHDRAAPAVIVWGFAKLDRLRATAAKVRCSARGADIAEISIQGQGASGNALVQIRMYRLPAADLQLAADLKAESEQIEPAPPPANDPSNLRSPRVPPDWRHKTVFASDGRRIVHAFRGGGRAMIVRYSVGRGLAMEEDLFRWTARNLGIVDAAWLLD